MLRAGLDTGYLAEARNRRMLGLLRRSRLTLDRLFVSVSIHAAAATKDC